MGIYVSGPELVYAGSVFVACGASAYGALIASHARENKRRARQSWRRADKRWAEVHEEVLALEEIKAELAETRTDRVMEAVTTGEQLREAARQNAWCPCKVIPMHLVKDHPHACSDPECTDTDCTDEHIAEGYSAQVLAFGDITPENGRTEAKLIPIVETAPPDSRRGDEECLEPDCPAAGQEHQVYQHSFICRCNAPISHTIAEHQPGWGSQPCP